MVNSIGGVFGQKKYTKADFVLPGGSRNGYQPAIVSNGRLQESTTWTFHYNRYALMLIQQ